MKTFAECGAEVGYDRNSLVGAPEVKYTYFLYKDGVATEISLEQFHSTRSAQTLVGKVATKESKAAYDAFWADLRVKEQLAADKFMEALREEFSYLDGRIFSLCYSKAYEDGHSDGYDAVANKMVDYCDFAEQILKLKE